MPHKHALQFVLMPLRGVRARDDAPSAHVLAAFAPGMEVAVAKTGKHALRVLDSVHEDGIKLVEMSAEAARAWRAEHAGLRLVPLRDYVPMVHRFALEHRIETAALRDARRLSVRVTSAASGKALAGCDVVAFTDFAARRGASARTDKSGVATLKLPSAVKTLDLLYVDPGKDHWSYGKRNVKISAAGLSVKLKPLAGAADALAHFYGLADLDIGKDVRVGVVDSGVGPHPDLAVAGGLNAVVGENPADYTDNGLGHGTHVARIIGARGTPPAGLRGQAPACELYSYRVFGKGKRTASSFSIAKAIDAAVAQGCHLINLSLGGGAPDEVISEAIAEARLAGCVVVAANGNGGRRPVSFPASDPRALAVAAFGRKRTFPADSIHRLSVASPYGKDKKDFVADFTNIGPETDLAGPGVGIISTVPGGYAAWNGTSMATPAVCGRIAALWGADRALLAMPANAERSARVIEKALSSGVLLGFGQPFEGAGRL